MEWYLQSAYNNFLALMTWCRETTILSVYGTNVTFLGLIITCVLFSIIVKVIWYIIDVNI